MPASCSSFTDGVSRQNKNAAFSYSVLPDGLENVVPYPPKGLRVTAVHACAAFAWKPPEPTISRSAASMAAINSRATGRPLSTPPGGRIVTRGNAAPSMRVTASTHRRCGPGFAYVGSGQSVTCASGRCVAIRRSMPGPCAISPMLIACQQFARRMRFGFSAAARRHGADRTAVAQATPAAARARKVRRDWTRRAFMRASGVAPGSGATTRPSRAAVASRFASPSARAGARQRDLSESTRVGPTFRRRSSRPLRTASR